jgi:hypothetical protein
LNDLKRTHPPKKPQAIYVNNDSPTGNIFQPLKEMKEKQKNTYPLPP